MQKYLRLLNYPNAQKVIEFINKDKNDDAHIIHGGVSMTVSAHNWGKVEAFIQSLNVRYSITSESPRKVVGEMVADLKDKGVINCL